MKLSRLFDALAAKASSDSAAVLDRDYLWSYQELATLVDEFDEQIGRQYLPPGCRVAILARNSVETIALMLAIGRMGHAVLAVSPGLGGDIRETIYDSNAIFCELSAKLSDRHAKLERAKYLNEALLEGCHAKAPDCALMLTTSGSTGIPKVVALSEAGIDAFISWSSRHFGIGAESRVLNYSPLNFDLTLLEVWAPLAVGASTIICNPDKIADGRYLLSLINKAQPHIVQAVPCSTAFCA